MSEHDSLKSIASAMPPDALSADDVDRLLRHADECADCSAEYRELAARAMLAQAPALRLDDVHAARLRARVLAGVAGKPEPAAVPRSRRRALTPHGGWLVAASLAVALLAHHGFHEPLSSGWLAAAGIGLVAVALGVYASSLSKRLERLEYEIRSRERAAPPDHAR